MPDLDPGRLAEASIARGMAPIRWVAETGSTNDDVRAWAVGGAPSGTALVAERQSRGRGRLGRRWETLPGDGLALSVLVRPKVPPARIALVNLGVAVAVADLAEPLGIKWPNDVLDPDGRKVAGILAEAELSAGAVSFVVIGVGLNVHGAPEGAACLDEVVGRRHDRAELAARLARGIVEAAGLLERDPGALLGRWRERARTLGQPVRIGEVRGIAEDVDPDGALLVRDGGTLHRVVAGDVLPG